MLCQHSFHSLNYGVLSPEEWIDWALATGQKYLALTDINSTAGSLEFYRRATEAGIQPVLGLDYRENLQRNFLVLARTNAGFESLNRALSERLSTGQAIEPETLVECFIIYPWQSAPARALGEHEYLGIYARDLERFRLRGSAAHAARLVAWEDQSFRHKRDYNTHRLLRAIGENSLLSKLPPHLQAAPRWNLRSPEHLAQDFAAHPVLWQRSQRLLQQCSLSFRLKDYRESENQRFFGESRAADRARLRQLCEEGLSYRYRSVTPELRQRLEHELQLIEERNFFSYFLINWDIVRYARRRNFFYVGRGSGANSLVAYLLRITDVDPLALKLYFERFINRSRQQPPDFDIDFSWRDRPALTAYIFERYPRACLLGAQTTYRFRAGLRELGKVLGIPPAEIELLQKRKDQPPPRDSLQALALRYAQSIAHLPHRQTVHSSGILIPEREIYHYGATWLPPKGFPTVQFDMHSAEDFGLHKFDILGQRGLAKIKECLEIIKREEPEAALPDIHNTRDFYEDPQIKALLREGRTVGCFYIESPAMRSLLKKLRADNYLALVAASSIIRPGVAASGMMAEYIRRYREPERRRYPHPLMEELLSETYGVMVYQEDVLKVAHYFAGLSLEEADVLRRGMSWKFRERRLFESIRAKFFANCQAKGYPEALTEEVWRQMESFGNYAFAKGHSASYAVESYQSLYLKAYYPLAYMVACVNNGGGFYSVETYLNEARLHGGDLALPCIQRSGRETRLRGKTILLGFQLVRDLEEESLEQLLRERRRGGPYRSLAELCDRVAISLEQLLILIRTGALRQIEADKKKLLWQAHFLFGKKSRSRPVADLFRSEQPRLELPPLEHSEEEEWQDQMELLGFPLALPFALLSEAIDRQGLIQARDLSLNIGREVRMLGYLVHVKSLHTRGAERRLMQFGCFLDEKGHFIDTVHFPNTAARYPFQGRGLYLLQGRVQEEYDFLSLEVQAMERLR